MIPHGYAYYFYSRFLIAGLCFGVIHYFFRLRRMSRVSASGCFFVIVRQLQHRLLLFKTVMAGCGRRCTMLLLVTVRMGLNRRVKNSHD